MRHPINLNFSTSTLYTYNLHYTTPYSTTSLTTYALFTQHDNNISDKVDS